MLGLAVAASVLAPWLHGAAAVPEDDAEYYRLIAANIARSGVSTFDGLSLTNGYHPLWQAVMVLQYATAGGSFLVTRVIEAVMICAAFPLLLRATGLRTALGAALFLAFYGRLVAGLALTGMEISALVATTALTVWAAAPSRIEGAWRMVALGAAAAAAVLSRLDAAVFVLPLVAFAPLERRTRLGALGVAAGVGAIYAAYNLTMFGSLLPLSSTVKSLGGLQVNARVLDQLALDWREHGPLGRYVQTFGLLTLSPVCLLASRPGTIGRALAAATLVGGLLFTAKIVFGSSWRIWPWYNFPVLFGLMAAAATLGPRLEEAAARWGRRSPRMGRPLGVALTALAAVLLVGLTAKAAVTLRRPPPVSTTRFDELNARAARLWAPVLRGAPVAMGDRAGAFAAAYRSPVMQLEGLVNDRAYLEALKRGGDVTPLLCRRGVRFVLAYRPELGDYATHRMPVLRPALTQYKGPTVTLDRADEVGRLRDRSVLDLRGVDEADDTLILWRLGRCDRARS